jgi:DNA end-binding protein Ku
MPSTIWKGYISFGLISFPVRLSAAARPDPIHFHMLHEKDQSRVKEVFFCVEEDKPLTRDEIVKGYEFEKGKYVLVTSADLEKIAPATARTMEIVQFVKSSEVDPIFLEKSYYVAPEKDVSKPYMLLAHTMRLSGYDAIAKLSMHGREHVVTIRATDDGLVLHTLYFLNEMHEANKVKIDKKEFSKQEVTLAQKLIETLAAPFDPKQFHDEYRQNVETLIEQKRKGQKIKPVPQKRVAPVVSIMEALQKSLAQVSKASAPKGKAGQSTKETAAQKPAKGRKAKRSAA